MPADALVGAIAIGWRRERSLSVMLAEAPS
jgi:hypothetical protein